MDRFEISSCVSALEYLNIWLFIARDFVKFHFQQMLFGNYFVLWKERQTDRRQTDIFSQALETQIYSCQVQLKFANGNFIRTIIIH